jgi:Ferritin-like domain
MGEPLSRGGVLRLALAGAGLATLGGPAAALAAGVPDVDVSYLRVLVATELLKTDFASTALASGRLGARSTGLVRRVRGDDGAHYAGLAALLGGAGQAPATADDIDFSYPKGSFGSERSILGLAWKLGTLTLGAYLGAVENVLTATLRLPIGQIAANEAQQLSALAAVVGRPAIGGAFAGSLAIDAVSSALDEYES